MCAILSTQLSICLNHRMSGIWSIKVLHSLIRQRVMATGVTRAWKPILLLVHPLRASWRSWRKGINPGRGRMKVYVPKGASIPANMVWADIAGEQDHTLFLDDGGKLPICERFERNILLPLAKIFGLAPDVISIFWDKEGPTIAFNRGGSLYCNAWVDLRKMVA